MRNKPTKHTKRPSRKAKEKHVNLSSVDSFKNLGIVRPVLKSIAEKGFEQPTEIQKKTIPLVLAGKDVIAKAATGSGKTLAFGSGIIQNLERRKGVQALVLAPTRELAMQASEALKDFSKYKSLRVVTVYGGVGIGNQIRALQSAEVVVGTPGRLLDHMRRDTLDLTNIKILVLDEADRMLDMGFLDDVQKLIRACPKERQTLLFSATVSSGVANLAKKYMKDPQQVFAESYVDPKKLKQIYYDVDDREKFSLLLQLLKSEKSELVMVFCNTRKFVDFITKHLNEYDVNAMAIHGGLKQAKRTRTLGKFHSQNIQVLVCTDVAARGLDIPQVSHIYNFDIPSESDQYIHRIGRTARAGKEGKVINLVGRRDHDNFRKVKREIKVDIPRERTPSIKRVEVQLPKSRGQSSGRRNTGPGRTVRRPRKRTESSRSSESKRRSKPVKSYSRSKSKRPR